MNLKEQYHKFRAWQRKPSRFSVKDTSAQQCACCGHKYEGNFCPVCGQTAGDGRLTWRWVWKNVMLLWGMDSRSMPYTLWQLLLRPGYLIGEYISGHRQVSYPPVKMLVLVALFYVILKQLLGIEASPTEVSDYEILNRFFEWETRNPGWGVLTFTLIMTLPTWILFRFAPRHPYHTWPEGIFIQVFISSLLLIASFLSEALNDWFAILIPIFYFITYRQLFGYSVWGTVWRLLQCLIVWLILIGIILSLPTLLSGKDKPTWIILITYLFLLAIAAAILGIGYGISKKNRYRQHPDKQ